MVRAPLALLQDSPPASRWQWALVAVASVLAWLAFEQLSSQLWFLPAGLRLALLWLTPARRWGWLGASEVAAQAVKSLVLGYPLFTTTFLAVCVAPWLVYAAVVLALRGPQPVPAFEGPTRMIVFLLAGLLGAAGVSPLLWMFLVTVPMSTADTLAEQLDAHAATAPGGKSRVAGRHATPMEALRAAVSLADPADRIVVFGSFFTVGGVLQNGVPRLSAKHLAA